MVDGLAIDHDVDCRDAETRPLLIIQRHGFANFYHSSEDLFNAFLALLITGLRPDEVSVLLADLYPWGPFEAFWRRLFPDVRTAWEARADPPRCHRKIIIGIFGPASPLTVHSKVTQCRRSPLVRAYARWAWHAFDLAPRQRPAPGERLRLLWMSRRASTLWPERAYCDDRYFACAEWAHLGVRKTKRVLDNDAAVVAALQARPELNVTSADFSAVPFERQVAEAAAADILAGPHGAGLTHLLFLPDWACVVELQIDGSGSKHHFANLAAWRGLTYAGIHPRGGFLPGPVVDSILTACSSLLPPASTAPGLKPGKRPIHGRPPGQ